MYSNSGGNHNPYQDMKYLHQDERFAHSYADLYGAVPSESNSTGRLITQPQWRTSTEEVKLANKDANKDADSSDDDSSMCHLLTPFFTNGSPLSAVYLGCEELKKVYYLSKLKPLLYYRLGA